MIDDYIPRRWMRNEYNEDDKEFICDLCGHSTHSESVFQIHREKPHTVQCDECEVKTTTRNTLFLHKVDHY